VTSCGRENHNVFTVYLLVVGLHGLPQGTAALRNLEPGFAASLLALSFFSALPQQANLLQKFKYYSPKLVKCFLVFYAFHKHRHINTYTVRKGYRFSRPQP
jgi:hypothetical protein